MMEKEFSFSINGNCSPTMNYLVFLHNIYLNKYRGEIVPQVRRMKFPYMDVDAWGLLDRETFQKQFRLLWSQMIQAVAVEGTLAVRDLIHTHRDKFLPLFTRDEAGSSGLEKSYLSFIAWWNNGGEGTVREGIAECLQVIQEELKDECSVRSRDLHFEFVYDEFPVSADLNFGSNFVLVPPLELRYVRSIRKLPKPLFEKVILALGS